MNPGFWNAKKVLVTGHTGFKGTWLSLWLQALGADVIGYSPGTPRDPSMFALTRAGQDMACEQGDIRDTERLTAVVAAHRPEVVLHLAGRPLVRAAFRDPVSAYSVNVLGTVNALEAARMTDSVRAVVIVTTDKVYENRNWRWGYREPEAKGGDEPYSSSKACAELAVDAYRKSYFAEPDAAHIASARSGNVIGGGDWSPDRLIPDAIRATLDGEPLLVRNPEAIRPWQHVLNSLHGYLLLAERLWESSAYADAWNFGPLQNDARPVREVLAALGAAWGRPVEWVYDERPNPPETRQMLLDSTMARTKLGWSPCWDLEQALVMVANWYLAYESGDDLRSVTLGQVEQYQSELHDRGELVGVERR